MWDSIQVTGVPFYGPVLEQLKSFVSSNWALEANAKQWTETVADS